MLKFNKIKLSNNILDGWIANNLNVCLVGKHGIGKSTIILDAFNRHNLKYKYFSASTLDPWVDFLGIPTVKAVEDKSYIDFILPQGMDEDLEAIFLDEFGREAKQIRNALMELIQFKSINGRSFPKLRFIWVAMNPSTDSDTYNVEEIDPAQLDRFHIITELYDEPDVAYFSSKFPEHAKPAIDWYKQQSKEVLSFLSPRRLDYVLEAIKNGVNPKYLLPADANTSELVKLLNKDVKQAQFDEFVKNKDYKGLGAFLSDQSNFARFNKEYKRIGYKCLEHVNPEILDTYALSNDEFRIHRKASTFDPQNTKFFNTAALQTAAPARLAKTQADLLAEIVTFKKANNIYCANITQLTNNWRYTKYHNNFTTMVTQDKRALLSAFWLTLDKFDQYPPMILHGFLISLGQCQVNTIKRIGQIDKFIEFAGQILKLTNSHFPKSYGNLEVLFPQYI